MRVKKFAVRTSRLVGAAPIGKWSEVLSATDARVTFVCQAGYHMSESLAVANELRRQGLTTRIVIPERGRGPAAPLHSAWHRVKEIETLIEGKGGGLGRILTNSDILESTKVLVLFNDWGITRDLVRSAKDHGIVIVGWVEGVQDLTNSDTGRDVTPYQSCDVVFDIFSGRKNFFPKADVYEIGSERLQELVVFSRTNLEQFDVLINLNFTYGIHSEARKQWARQVVSAAKAAGLNYAISRHPADRRRPGYLWRSSGSSSQLLPETKLLITRFGTAILDAAVMQIPAIYFNPHGEKLLDTALKNLVYQASTKDALMELLRAPLSPKLDRRSVLSMLALDRGESPSCRASRELKQLVGENNL